MELWDLYHKDGTPAGKDHIRGEELPDGLYHLVINVWIKNSKGEYLISQRAADRPTHPLMWECTGGAAVKGETSPEAAVREVREEVGIDLSPEQGRLVFTRRKDTVNGKRYNEIIDVWLFEYDGEFSLEKATTCEVADAKWMTRETIADYLKSKKLIGDLAYFFTEIDV